uniref:Putative phosphoglycerate mutase family protein R708 n=1 Tax=Anthurium amnicola TaxID=1678845 RepID=A0A1D1XKP8_9ARAE
MGESSASCGEELVQNVVVMRHGDRIDSAEPLWPLRADRPWDPPLTEDGKARAWNTGKKLRAPHLGFPIHRVVVSPFLRCLQTAGEVVTALCADGCDESGLLAAEFSGAVPIDPSRVKVSIEYGLCEALCRQAIRVDWVPTDGKWFPDVSELEALLPPGTVDHSVERVYQELPQWEEPLNDARQRYQNVILALANKYPNENLLLVTHGECVGVGVCAFLKGIEVFEVEFCAYSHLQRKIIFEDGKVCTAEGFNVLTVNGKTGISYYSS